MDLKRCIRGLCVSAMVLACAAARGAIPPQERAALIAIHNALDGPNWRARENWLGESGTECSWRAVTCDAAGTTVTGLDLGWNNARGVLPPQIGDLPNLEVLTADGSTISGALPPDIGRLSKLRTLNLTGYYDNLGLSGNEISGPLPREIGQLTSLRELYLEANRITSIPADIASLSNLEVLTLSYNPLEPGPLPPAIFRMPKLRVLRMVRNNLTGPIPAIIDLPSIAELLLSENQLTGEIPSSIGEARTLVELRLNENNLTGPLPASLGQLTELTKLDLGRNAFQGRIPSLSNLTRLQELLLYRSGLTGSLEPWIGQLRELTTIYLHENSLSGPLPAEFFTLPKLATIYIGDNHFSGSLGEFGKLAAARVLSLGPNDFSGPFPVELTRLPELVELTLNGIVLNGTIPAEIGQLRKLESLNLESTSVSGAIPEELGDLPAMSRLNLRRNALTKLPLSLEKLTRLTMLTVAENRITGPIPAGAFARMPSLAYVDLSFNELGGPLPQELFSSSALVWASVAGNRLTGAMPAVAGAQELSDLDVRENELTALPADLASLRELRRLDAGSNRLSGIPPSSLAALRTLEVLKLAENRFSGPIPDLSTLTSLRELHLQGNAFVGAIPQWIGTITSLRSLLLNANRLSGRIPANIVNLSNLAADYALQIDDNALYTDSAAVKAFLDARNPGWDRRQTVAPSDVGVVAQRERAITLSWTPIAFSSGPGGYQIGVATAAAGPYSVLTTTPSKSMSTFIVDGLAPSSTYFFALSTVSYPSGGQRNVVTSDLTAPVASSTTSGAPAPPSVVVFVHPGEIHQRPGESGTTTYVVANLGDLPSHVTLAEGDLFTQEPASFTLPGEATQVVTIRGKPKGVGAYTAEAAISGDGVASGLSVRVSVLVTEPPSGVVSAEASLNRIDVAAKITESASGSVDFTNAGAATLQGIVISNVAWIIPPSGLVVIPPGETRTVTFTVDQTKRPDASSPAGAVTGTLSLSYESGVAGAGKTAAPNNGASVTKTTPVTVVYTITPPTQSVSFPPFAQGEVALFVAGAGNVAGAKGTYISDVAIVNVFGTESPRDIRMYYTPADPSASTVVTEVKELQPNQGITFANVVKTVFEGASLGTIQIRTTSVEQLFVNANIFNVTDRNGTYGTALPIFRSDRAMRPGEAVFLTGLHRDDARTLYTNIFIQETSGGTGNYEIEFHDSGGKRVGEVRTGSVAPFRLALLTDAVPVGAVAARITNAAGSGGRIIAYATPLDAVSGDFWTVADWNRELGAALDEPVIIPVAGAVHGGLNTFFRTDVSVTNRAAAGGQGTLTFYDRGGARHEREITLGGGESLVAADVISTSFPDLTEPLGYLQFEPHDSSFSLTSRTFATRAALAGTFGTGVPVLPRSAALRLGQSKIITGLDVASPMTTAAGKPGTYRTNIGLVEIGGSSATVEVTVIYNDIRQLVSGVRLTTLRYEVGAHGFVSASLAEEIRKGNPNVSDLRSVQLKFRVVAGEGAIIPYTSSVDNGTQDQILRVQ
jgi:Leucine-rich repeat (LRR) protein